MAVITVIAAANMARIFTGGDTAVMAAGAGTDDIHVVDTGSGSPGIETMAVRAVVG